MTEELTLTNGKTIRGRPRVEELFTDTELAGGKPRALLAAEYAEEKRFNEKEIELIKLARAKGFEIDFPDDEERAGDLKKLTIQDRFILSMSMAGMKQIEISRKTGIHYSRVHKVVNSTMGRRLMDAWAEGLEVELEGLRGLAIDAVRTGLESGDKKLKLLAVDRLVKLTGEGNGGTNVTVNVVNEARGRFINDLKDLSEKRKIIDGEFKKVD